MIRIRTIAWYQDFSGGAFTGRWERGGADEFEVGEGLRCVGVDAAQDEEVGGDAGIGRVVPVERRHTQVESHLLAQERDVRRHESDEEWRPGDRPVDSSGADRASALPVGERRWGASGCGVAYSLRPLARAGGVAIDRVDRQALGDVVWIALGEAYQHAGDPQAVSCACPDARRLNRVVSLGARVWPFRLSARLTAHQPPPPLSPLAATG